MNTLLMRCEGVLQSWGIHSRFTVRITQREPTKSGIVGMLAAALGRQRTEPIADLAELRMGVRVDRPGRLLEDYHTISGSDTVSGETLKHAVVTKRHYLSDASFLVGMESGDAGFLEQLLHSLDHPVWPLALGRKACVPASKIGLAVVARGLEDALREHPWYGRTDPELRTAPLRLGYVIDAPPGPQTEERPDFPLSFDPSDRRFSVRSVRTFELPLPENLVLRDPLCSSPRSSSTRSIPASSAP